MQINIYAAKYAAENNCISAHLTYEHYIWPGVLSNVPVANMVISCNMGLIWVCFFPKILCEDRDWWNMEAKSIAVA